jgi:hypothetical protein
VNRLCRRCGREICTGRKQRCESCALFCYVPGCPKARRPGDRRCRAHTAAAWRAYRARNLDEVRRRELDRAYSDEQLALRRARAFVATYLKRGKLEPADHCEAERCRIGRVTAWWDDPKRPRDVRWLCADHYSDAAAERVLAAANARRYAEEQTERRVFFSSLTPEQQALVEREARGGPDGAGNWAPGTIMYVFAWRRALARILDEFAEALAQVAPATIRGIEVHPLVDDVRYAEHLEATVARLDEADAEVQATLARITARLPRRRL